MLCVKGQELLEVAEELAGKQQMEKTDQKGKNGKEEKEKSKEKKKPEKAGKKAEDEGWKMGSSNFLSVLEEGSTRYKVFWQNRDEGLDFLQDHDPELIKEGQREEVEEEIRVQVDGLMEEKLRNLKVHVDGEKVGAQKKGGKAEKAGKASSKKKIPELERDLTPDRTVDSLYQELAEGGLLIKAKAVNLSDYIGHWGSLRKGLHGTGTQPLPSPPAVRQLVALYGILPLGSQMVHENAPLVKSLLLAGPAGVGKRMLVHAICTETGANLFNLTPSNIAGKYPGKEGLLMMLHMILKVGKHLQPSVLWIGDTEKLFSKAAPKGEEEVSGSFIPEQVDSKCLGKMLPQLLKAVKAEDRLLLVGTSARPFKANLGPFCKVYQKIILIPRPDYLSRFGKYLNSSWWALLFRIRVYCLNGGALSSLESLSWLARLSDGFTQGHILEVVQTVLSELKLLQMPRKPLRTVEFVASLARHIPVYKEEEETFELDSEQPLTARAPVTRYYTALVTGDLRSLEVLTDQYRQDVNLVFEITENELEWQVKSQALYGLSGLWALERRWDRSSPLCLAAQHGHTAVLRHLLRRGAHPDLAPGAQGPLHEACRAGHTDCAELLLEHGADPNLRS
ncbi:IQ motif containing with AAA domain 1 [Willisornis vidua]|uniref:IQ motif containing with AAA domain 1 n=1 Tax=Willisornis vidua TaxID=1566151 RepID=A0ABQ9D9X0_9PASS|nr:IQ motif containing with AAA domain 1 [Willisornis vidua]